MYCCVPPAGKRSAYHPDPATSISPAPSSISKMAAIAHIVDEFRASLNWIVPISLLTTAILGGHWPFPPHSHSHPQSHRNAPSSSPPSRPPQHYKSRRPKDAMYMPGGGEKLGSYDCTWENFEKMNSEPVQPVEPESKSPFMDLPLEIRMAILEYCAPIPSERRGASSWDTFLALLRVSKAVQHEAYMACLPHLPLALWTKKGIRSFRALLQRRQDLGCLVRYLWIGTGKYDEEELMWALDVLRAATQLRSFACGEFFLAKAVNAGTLARTCQRLTLMNVERGVEYKARHVAHLRLCAGTYSTKEKFPDVTSLCFNARRRNALRDERARLEYEAVDKWVESLERFVVVERDDKRVSSRGLGLKFKVRRERRADMFSVQLPARWTEWDIWSADVVGAGVWDMCRVADAPPR